MTFQEWYDREHGNTPLEAMLSKAPSEQSKEAIRLAYEVADIVLFHARVRKNAEAMNRPWQP